MDALKIMNDPSLSNYVDGGTDCECLFWGYGTDQDGSVEMLYISLVRQSDQVNRSETVHSRMVGWC